jgi:hypothetical protein
MIPRINKFLYDEPENFKEPIKSMFDGFIETTRNYTTKNMG